MKANTWIWVTLLLLSALSFFIGETVRGSVAPALLLGAAGLKSGMVGWQFMELRSAHIIWKLALFALLAAILGLVCLLVQLG